MLRFVSLGAVLAALALAGCDAPSSSGSADASKGDGDHNYAMRDGDSYGYQGQLSEDEKKSGAATKKLMMVRYLGEENGVFSIAIGDPVGGIFACEKPCKYIKQTDLSDGSTEMLPNNPDSLVGEQIEDAENGKLEVSKAAQDEVAKAKAESKAGE